MAGEIVHIELPSSDFARSAAFYGKLFGWKTDGVQSGGHLLFELPGGVQGSWIRDALAQAPGPVPFVAVIDVEKALGEAERQGGRILVRGMALANRGTFGLLADCDGNVIGVLSPRGKGAENVSAIVTPTVAVTVAPVAAGKKDSPAAAKPGNDRATDKASTKTAAKAGAKKTPTRKR
jgi:uncharacterized protein